MYMYTAPPSRAVRVNLALYVFSPNVVQRCTPDSLLGYRPYKNTKYQGYSAVEWRRPIDVKNSEKFIMLFHVKNRKKS